MTLHARVLSMRPDPVRVARALGDEPGFAFLHAATGEGASYVACRPSERSTSLDPEPGFGLGTLSGGHAGVPRWIGLLPYEARRALERPRYARVEDREAPFLPEPVWHRYGAVVRVAEDVRVVGDDPAAVRALAELLEQPGRDGPVSVQALGATEPDAAHAARIQAALGLILEGEIYQVNLARRFDFSVRGRAFDVLLRLSRRTRVPFAAAFEWEGASVASLSPELFLECDPRGRLFTAPIKGTRPRGVDARADLALGAELEQDPKERAELSMVVDVERNDLGRVAKVGSVRVLGEPVVRPCGSVHHRIARVVAALRPDVSRTALLESMLPSGSVTGAPKIRAIEIIGHLESARRGLYTGAFGFLAHDGSLRLAMAIRTLVAREGTGHYFAGGGIVLGSDPDREVEETRWKASQILGLLSD